jgi:hypothetical protein
LNEFFKEKIISIDKLLREKYSLDSVIRGYEYKEGYNNINYKKKERFCLSLTYRGKKIEVYLKFKGEPSQFLVNKYGLKDYCQKGRWGIKGWQYLIRSEQDYKDFISLLGSPELFINSYDD